MIDRETKTGVDVEKFIEATSDMPRYAALLSSGDLKEKYRRFLELANEIGVDAIMREIEALMIDRPPSGLLSESVVSRAFAYEQRNGWDKARRAFFNLLDIMDDLKMQEPVEADFGASSMLAKMGYDNND